MNTTVESFLTASQEKEVIEAIRVAEKQTSGEIRVHLENFKGEDVENRAKEVFHLLKMDVTKLRNGVILYVAINLKQFYIYGDKGIHTKVGDSFWINTRDELLEAFIKGDFSVGLSNGILQIGKALKTHFPWDITDINELPDEISKG